jgi:hypothetical protein
VKIFSLIFATGSFNNFTIMLSVAKIKIHKMLIVLFRKITILVPKNVNCCRMVFKCIKITNTSLMLLMLIVLWTKLTIKSYT